MMSYVKFKSKSYCVDRRHYSDTIINEGEVTETGRKLLIGKCVKCNRKKPMTVNDNTIAAEGLGNFFKNIGKASK